MCTYEKINNMSGNSAAHPSPIHDAGGDVALLVSMPLLVLCQAAWCQDPLYVRSALQVGQLQHVHLYVSRVSRQHRQCGQYFLHKVITMVTNSS